MKSTKLFGGACALVLVIFAAATGDDGIPLKVVTARDIKLHVPESWSPVKLRSRFRAAHLSIPNEETAEESADLIVYYFGGTTGGIRANVTRWIEQFHQHERQVELLRGASEQGRYVLVNV